MQHAEAITKEERPTESLWCKSEPTQTERKPSKRCAAPLGLCGNLVNALKLLENQLKDGDSPTRSIITFLHERSRRGSMDGQRRFIEADNHSAVDVSDFRRGTKSVSVKKPKFSETFPEAAIRGGADELTLRADEVNTQWSVH